MKKAHLFERTHFYQNFQMDTQI